MLAFIEIFIKIGPEMNVLNFVNLPITYKSQKSNFKISKNG